jgi:hypothetical protein
MLTGADLSGEGRDHGGAVLVCLALIRADRGTCRLVAVQPAAEQTTTEPPARLTGRLCRRGYG